MKSIDTIKENLDQYDFTWNQDEVIFQEKLSYSKLIGEFLISFSDLESSLNLLIAEQLNGRSHEPGYQILKYLGYYNKVNLSKDLYDGKINFINNSKLKTKIQKEFSLIIFKCYELGTFRNKIAHANWMTLDKKFFVRTKILNNPSVGIEFIKSKIDKGILLKYTGQCYNFARRIDHFLDKISAIEYK